MKLLFATGGSGGHIYPALAVAQVAREQGDEVIFMGQAGGMEEQLVPEAGFEFIGALAGRWNRDKPDPRQALKAIAGLWRAAGQVRRLKPDLVLGFGGFASFPGCVGAVLARRPLVLQEGNAFPSRVNRWFASRARLVISAYPEALPHLNTTDTEVIPFPVRETRVDRSAARQALGLPQDAVVTLVMGGSQGSLTLNRQVPAAFEQLPEDSRPVVLHSSGRGWISALRERTADLANYHAHEYLDAPTAWAAADLAITRSGVGTLSEASFHGVPLVMVPLPTAAENHQLHNARAFEAAGAGKTIEESNISNLPEVWLAALQPGWRRSASAAARSRSPEGAAARILSAAKGKV